MLPLPRVVEPSAAERSAETTNRVSYFFKVSLIQVRSSRLLSCCVSAGKSCWAVSTGTGLPTRDLSSEGFDVGHDLVS